MSKRYIFFPLLLLLCIMVTLQHVQIIKALPYIDIDVDTAYEMITNSTFPNLVILDVRSQEEYDSGHLYDAFLIPYDKLEARIGELKDHENHEIIVYSMSGSRSAIACGTLDAHNFTEVYNVQGGILAWKAAGYPVWPLRVHNIDTNKNYSGMQEAISAIETQDGDTIMVEVATYYERVVVNKAVTLMAKHPEATIIDGNGTGNVIEIVTENVEITGFTIQDGSKGIFIEESDNSVIYRNIITKNLFGIEIFAVCGCAPVRGSIIRHNNIANNSYGIKLVHSEGSLIYHNNFMNNTKQVIFSDLNGSWNDSYPSGGNYWSDYNGTDDDQDGIGDTAYIIDDNNQDNYPLMGMFSDFPVTWETQTYHVPVISNSTISDFDFRLIYEGGKAIRFNVIGEDGTSGFCRIRIPTALMNDTFTVLVNGTEVPYTLLPCSNATYSYLYFTYNHSTKEVLIMPEFPSAIILSLFMAFTLITIILTRGDPQEDRTKEPKKSIFKNVKIIFNGGERETN